MAKPKSPKPLTKLSERELVDEYVEFRFRVMAWEPPVNPHEARFDELAAEILRRQEKEPEKKTITLESPRFKLPISARKMVRSLLPNAVENLFKRWGQETYLKVCSPPALGTIDKLVPKVDRGQYVKEAFTGARTIGEPILKQAGGK